MKHLSTYFNLKLELQDNDFEKLELSQVKKNDSLVANVKETNSGATVGTSLKIATYGPHHPLRMPFQAALIFSQNLANFCFLFPVIQYKQTMLLTPFS